MATQPGPDIIEPAAPPERPVQPSPAETPATQPPEVEPPRPDFDRPRPRSAGNAGARYGLILNAARTALTSRA